jgi:DNA modification methylase
MQGLEEMRDELVPLSGRKISIELHHVGSEDFEPDKNSLDLIFSSPPYSGHEKYADEPTQSYVRFPTRREWLEGYLGATLSNCRHGLKSGGVLAINIANVPSYPMLESDFLALAKREGWRLISTLKIQMSRMLGTKVFRTGASKQYKTEPLFVFNKA